MYMCMCVRLMYMCMCVRHLALTGYCSVSMGSASGVACQGGCRWDKE